jgi:hypothetical protein
LQPKPKLRPVNSQENMHPTYLLSFD